MLRSNLNTINARIFNKTAIRIDDQALREVEACYRFLEKFEQGKVIYGINTGFGPMAQYRIGDADLNSLQYNIIRSHSCGAGEALPAQGSTAQLRHVLGLDAEGMAQAVREVLE